MLSPKKIRFTGLFLFFIACGLFLAKPVFLWVQLVSEGVLQGAGPTLNLEFPANVDLGELWMFEDVNCFSCGAGQKKLGRATGRYQVKLPAPHWFVSLQMPKQASALMHYLSAPSLSDLGDLQLAGSNVTDEDLQYLKNTKLQSLDLSNTNINGSGLRYLKPHPKWLFLDLRNCKNLDVKFLEHFRGWKRVTLTVAAGYKWGEAYTETEKKLLDETSKIVCDGQPENICQTQIR